MSGSRSSSSGRSGRSGTTGRSRRKTPIPPITDSLREAIEVLGQWEHLHRLSDVLGRATQAGLTDSGLFEEQLFSVRKILEKADRVRVDLNRQYRIVRRYQFIKPEKKHACV